MIRIRLLFPAIALCAAVTALSAQEHDRHDEHGHAEEGHDEHAHDDHADAPQFRVTDFQEFGVTLAIAGPGDVDEVIELPAEVRPNADRLSHLAPPYPGIVRSVEKTVGDRVAAGDVLAVIESETLARYPLKAAFAGTVIDKHVTPGETVTRDDRLFIIGDLSTVWIEIDVYLEVLSQVREGQAVDLATATGDVHARGTVSYISPVVDPGTRTAAARVVLANEDGRWRPGSFVTASILAPLSAPLVVTRRSLQTMEGRSVVFVVEDGRFETRPVKVGRLGRRHAEILGGLSAGDQYADESSFVVKADLLKGEAEHQH